MRGRRLGAFAAHLRDRWKWIAFSAALMGLLIQLIPYGAGRPNPPVANEPEWNETRTRDLFFRACRDCHSNETVWPWYARVAPASWLVRWDVEAGREHFNVSEWGREHNGAEEAADMVRSGVMPLPRYVLLHPAARLSEAEQAELAAGLEATFSSDAANADGGSRGDEHGSEGEVHGH